MNFTLASDILTYSKYLSNMVMYISVMSKVTIPNMIT